MDIPKKNNSPKGAAASKPPETAKPAVPLVPVKLPPMFRKVDWLALGIAFIAVWAVYLWTLAPEVTLEDSGELCTGSFYAGIPHPPGYPFWAIYSWFWTFILPFGNVAWRVEVGESFAAAMGCGLLAMMVSRGGSMLIEGIEELKTLPREWENRICLVAGAVTGLLLGLGAFMWKESVAINRISLFGVPWMLAMILCLMRWAYAPNQKRYLYAAMLMYGWIATIHQSLLLSAPGVEVLLAVVSYRLGRDLFLTNSILFLVILFLKGSGNIPALNEMTSTETTIFTVVGLGSIAACIWLIIKTQSILTEWKSIGIMGVLWVVGVMVYLYEPVSCMTNPPMQWGYPRTVEGFFHALSRGQYGTGEGTNLMDDPGRFLFQLGYLIRGLAESFGWVYVAIGLIPFLFLLKMHKRERSWIIGLTAIYLCTSVVLVIVMNVTPDRSSSELCKVFFTASQAIFAIMIGYGITILVAYVATHYEKIRIWCLAGGVLAMIVAFLGLMDATGKLYFGIAGEVSLSQLPHYVMQAFAKDQYGLPVFANLILLAMLGVFLVALLVYRQRGPVMIMLVVFAVTPLCSGMTHWYKCEQRNHWFGYWFGHDMFTPPFTDTDGKLSYDNARRAELMKDPEKAKLIYPEMARNTILFGGTDPGRFCPTYIIFCESFIPHYCQPKQDQKFDRRDVYIITQNALADGTYLNYLRAQYNRSQQIDPPFFGRLFRYICCLTLGVGKYPGGVILDGQETGGGDSGNALVEWVSKVLYTTLDVPFLKWGSYIETKRRAEGVYPPKEIYIPSVADSQNCFQQYAQQKQLASADGRIQISGQVDVMNINGLLCKVIFDQNPTNEFYVEESFPLDWMYNYETPFGVIMKVNRQPVTELSEDVFRRDHEFWSKYSERLCGNWITYDTSVKAIADFCERTYIQNNYKGFIGNRAFVRDEDGQKAFSKLRSSQAGMYAWRCSPQCPPEFRQKSAASQAALIKETDFAFKQAFAFCPFSPEAVIRYVQFLVPLGRFDDAIIVAETCHKLDPYNDQITGLIEQLKGIKSQNAERTKAVGEIGLMENTARTNPGDLTNLIRLGTTYISMQQTDRGVQLLQQVL
ncbi:MAG TPA: DUF2723 domain-containing protein, partial [Verrucomicrobiae bacterium]